MRGLAPALLLSAAGCMAFVEPPEETALDRLLEAEALFAEGRWSDAEVRFAYVVSVRDRCLDAYVKLAECQRRRNDPEAAAATLERLLKVDPYHVVALRELARRSAEQGRREEALERYLKLQEALPGDRAAAAEIERLRK
jgi:DNA-binding SARP family transcriptional activator